MTSYQVHQEIAMRVHNFNTLLPQYAITCLVSSDDARQSVKVTFIDRAGEVTTTDDPTLAMWWLSGYIESKREHLEAA